MSEEDTNIPGSRDLAEIRRAPIVVANNELLLNTGLFEQLQRVAAVMASCETMPAHIKGKIGDAFRVAEQAFRWQLSPFMVAEKTFFVRGKIAYEGQLIAAVVNTRAGLEGNLNYRFHGDPKEPMTLGVTVFGKFPHEPEPRTVEVEWQTGYNMASNKSIWLAQPESQLSYLGARVFARRHCPETVLGAYTPEELHEVDYQGSSEPQSVQTSQSIQQVKPRKSKLERVEELIQAAKDRAMPTIEAAAETAINRLNGEEPEPVFVTQPSQPLDYQAFFGREVYYLEPEYIAKGRYRDWRGFTEQLIMLISHAPDEIMLAKLMADNSDTLKQFKVSSPKNADEVRKAYAERMDILSDLTDLPR